MMKTTTVGEIIKQERLKHQLSLKELSKRTRIRVEYLTFLENNQFDKLPVAVFVKGYIKTYARMFGFDYRPIIALLRRDYKESAKGQLVPREFIRPLLKRKKLWTPVTFVLLSLVIVFISLFSYVGWQWYNLNKPPMIELDKPESDALVATRVIVEGRTVPDATLFINNEPVAVKEDGTFNTEINLNHEGLATLTLEVTDRRGKNNVLQRTVFVRY